MIEPLVELHIPQNKSKTPKNNRPCTSVGADWHQPPISVIFKSDGATHRQKIQKQEANHSRPGISLVWLLGLKLPSWKPSSLRTRPLFFLPHLQFNSHVTKRKYPHIPKKKKEKKKFHNLHPTLFCMVFTA